MFHTFVANILSGCYVCFAMATHVFSSCFRRMLQVFHIDVAKVDLGVAHVAVGLICTWVWRGCHGAGAGHEAHAAPWCRRGTRSAAGHGAGHETRCEHRTRSGTGPYMKQA